MQPDVNAAKASSLIWSVARKELTLFFASPVAWLFLASFAAVELFVFFWGEAFFARNIADVRPLFSWMPLLLLFLTSALTMKVWSEERRSGTLEAVLTQGSPVWHFVLGKFLGCFVLLLLALGITLPLPVTVALLAELDWGPVLAGYLASVLLGSCYLAIGLFVSARSDNQIVSLLLSIAFCGALYLVGHPLITGLFSQSVASYLNFIGTGSRFDAITRGVLDFRDLYYYLALVLTFLVLNIYVLEKERFSSRLSNSARQWQWLSALAVLNLLLVNMWLGQLTQLRYDSTAGKQYSLSEATQQQLQSLTEPLLIRGYFSGQTHPLLAPLVPQLQDLLKEYQISGGGKVRVEWIDPTTEPELEQEANQRFNITPVPFQIADRYQSSIVSSYFNLLIQYGSEYQVLGFRELIDVKSRGENDLEVLLRNPELDITRAVKKVQQDYYAGHDLFAAVIEPVSLKLYWSDDQQLPAQLKSFATQLQQSAEHLAKTAEGKFSVQRLDPDADSALKDNLQQEFGLSKVKLDPFAAEGFWFSMQLQQGPQQLALTLDDFSVESFERQLKAGISRLSGHGAKTVALVTPQGSSGYGYPANEFSGLNALLADNFNVEAEDLTDGKVSTKADVLFVMAPENLSQTQLFAVDQFLMQGGTVLMATSPFKASLSRENLAVRPYQSGLNQWLEQYGVQQNSTLLLDPQHAALPVPVTRQAGGFTFQDMRLLDYPWFADIRQDAMAEMPLFSQLPQLVVPWASPFDIQNKENIRVTPLLHSSKGSWLSGQTSVMPTLDASGQVSYPSGDTAGSPTVAVMLEGQFKSWFSGKASPLQDQKADEAKGENEKSVPEQNKTNTELYPVLEQANAGARLILFGSNDMFSDAVSQLVGGAQGSEFLNNLQLLANTVDWATADPALLDIRARGQFNRTLPPLDRAEQQFLEYLNYALVLVLILGIALIQRWLQRRRLQQLYRVVTAQ